MQGEVYISVIKGKNVKITYVVMYRSTSSCYDLHMKTPVKGKDGKESQPVQIKQRDFNKTANEDF